MKTKMNTIVEKARYTFFVLSVFLYAGCTKNATAEDIIEENFPPEEFNLLSPENGAGPCSGVGPGFAQTFSWVEAKDPEEDDIRYTLMVDTAENPKVIVASDIIETSFTVSDTDLSPGQQYYWKVLAVDSLGNVTESQIFTFSAATLC